MVNKTPVIIINGTTGVEVSPATSTNQTSGDQKTKVVDSGGNVIDTFGPSPSKEVNYIEEATATITYIGSETAAGVYEVQKIDETSGVTITYATITNNPTVANLTAAWAARATTLVYNVYSTAY